MNKEMNKRQNIIQHIYFEINRLSFAGSKKRSRPIDPGLKLLHIIASL